MFHTPLYLNMHMVEGELNKNNNMISSKAQKQINNTHFAVPVSP